jgi:hypothetical protein
VVDPTVKLINYQCSDQSVLVCLERQGSMKRLVSKRNDQCARCCNVATHQMSYYGQRATYFVRYCAKHAPASSKPLVTQESGEERVGELGENLVETPIEGEV